MTWPRRATTPAATVNDAGNDTDWSFVQCPSCQFWEARIYPEIRRATTLMADVISTARVDCPSCEGR